MRRRPGIAGIRRSKNVQRVYQRVGNEIGSAQIEHMTKQMSAFKDNLEKFAQLHKNEINKNPVFRRQFQKMCSRVGVDPLASRKGFWSEILGLGDFYYELAVQAIEVCLQTKPTNGGLISLEELVSRLREKRGKNAQLISRDDVIQAVGKVSGLGSGFHILRIGIKDMVVSVPMELNVDSNAVLEEAQGKFFVTVSGLRKSLGWSEDRIFKAIDIMMQEGMVWVDEHPSLAENQFWVPSLFSARNIEVDREDD